MPRVGRRIPFLLLVVLVLAVGGCASEAKDGSRTLSKREYIAQANELQQDATKVFSALGGRLAPTPAAAKQHLAAFDELIAGYDRLHPPRDWRDEHATLLKSLRTMRQSVSIVSRASARNRRVITLQVGRYEAAQTAFEQAVRSINASR
ncbi:MAG: hypothetical protein JWL76_1295 [Thermoleophilia bacterium]|nr:hypothetical protein [Thermoleophilia bacterium]